MSGAAGPCLVLLAAFAACARAPVARVQSPAARVAPGAAGAAGTAAIAAETTRARAPETLVGRRARVRETSPGGPTIESVGIVRELNRDSIRLETEEDSLLPFALSPTVRLEISSGTKANVGRGAWMGALIGGGGLALFGASSCDGSGGIYDPTRGECFIAGTLLGAASGVPVAWLPALS